MGNKVYVQDGRFEQALRKFKNKVQDSGLLNDLRDRESYEKPTTARKKAKAQAVKRNQRRLQEESLPKKLY
jgi:small subunit ribosomal protein S21